MQFSSFSDKAFLKVLYYLLKELWRGASVTRALMNLSLIGISLEGDVLDAGAKDKHRTYYNYIDIQRAEINFCDLYSQDNSILRINFENEIDIPDNSYNIILLFNVLEHIFNHKLLLSELSRITKLNGRLIGFVPFQFPYHPDPSDFYRYTHICITRLLLGSGFKSVVVELVGVGDLIQLCEVLGRLLLHPFFRILRVGLILILFSASMLLSNFSTNNKCFSYLGIKFIATK